MYLQALRPSSQRKLPQGCPRFSQDFPTSAPLNLAETRPPFRTKDGGFEISLIKPVPPLKSGQVVPGGGFRVAQTLQSVRKRACRIPGDCARRESRRKLLPESINAGPALSRQCFRVDLREEIRLKVTRIALKLWKYCFGAFRGDWD